MTLAAILKPKQHPLIQYIKRWESFNNVDRRLTRQMLLKVFIGCLAFIAFAQFM